MLREQLLFETRNAPETAIKRIQAFSDAALQRHGDGYLVAFSGGKDSIAILDLVKRASVPFTAHMQMTSVDPPEVIRHVRQHYPEVRMERPRTTMWELIKAHKIPPLRTVRFCCKELKEFAGEGRVVVTGVRWAESVARSRRQMNERCTSSKNRTLFHPIIDWSTTDVWRYIRERELPYPALYDEGFKRIGCIGCPCASKANTLRDFERWPKFKALYLRAFSKIVPTNNWKSADDVMRWWLTRGGPVEDGLFSEAQEPGAGEEA